MPNILNIPQPVVGYGIISGMSKLTMYVSPLLFYVTSFSIRASLQLPALFWIGVCLAIINIMGAIIAAMYCICLVIVLAKMIAF